jgi:hypothetical protein
MKKVLVLLVCGALSHGAPLEVNETPATIIPAAREVGDLGGGQVFEDSTGGLMMVVIASRPSDYFSGNPNHVLHGVREQPPRPDIQVPMFIAGYGHFTIQTPGPIYVVDLKYGTLSLMRRDAWVRPVSKARLSVILGESRE